MTPLPRRATSADADAIAALIARAYGPYVPRIGRQPLPMTADQHRAVREHLVWVIDGDLESARAGEPAPVAVLELIPAADHLLIENVAVAPEHQGRGLGRALLDLAEREARRLGAGEVRLYTNERFNENLAIYARLGYRETRREPFRGLDVVHMRKVLEPTV